MTPPLRPRCECLSCRARRALAPGLLILLGILWLLHDNRGLSPEIAVGVLFVVWGAWSLVAASLPGPVLTEGSGSAPRHYRNSWFGPLLLLASGGLVLAHARLPGLVPQMVRDWPVLLILWGVVRLVEFYTARDRRRAGLTAGDVFLLLAIILIGMGLTRWYRLTSQPWWSAIGVPFSDWTPWLGSFHFKATAAETLAPGDVVLVRNDRGDITLIAAAGNTVAVSLDDVVHAAGEPAARAIFQSAQPVMRRQGQTWVVEPAGGHAGPGLETNLTLRLPPTVQVQVEAGNGDLSVQGWRAGLQLDDRRGDINVGDASGDVTVAAAHGDLSLTHLGGNLTVTGSGDDLTATDVAGSVNIKGEFSGDITLRNLAHAVEYSSSRTELSASAVPGSVTFDLDDMTVENAAGLTVTTRNKTINATGLQGPVQITDAHESVAVTLAAPPQAPITLRTSSADLSLTLPAASQFTLTASAPRGEIHSDFPLPTRHGSDVNASVGSRPTATIQLNTTSGNIDLHRN